MNPNHKQKKSQEPDAPDWWIKATLDAMVFGTGVVLVHHGKEPEHVPPEKYLEVAEALKWADKQIKENTQ